MAVMEIAKPLLSRILELIEFVGAVIRNEKVLKPVPIVIPPAHQNRNQGGVR